MERKEVNIVQGILIRNNLHCYACSLNFNLFNRSLKKKLKEVKDLLLNENE